MTEEDARVVIRDVTPDECPWLANVPVPIVKGMTVYRFRQAHYGAVRQFAATLDPEGDYPFFELPHDAVALTTPPGRSGTADPGART